MRPRHAARRIAALGTAILFAVLALTVYRSFVFSEFSPIRIGVVDVEQTASRRIVTIPLPDLSSLRGHTAVLAFRLRNGGSEPKRIGLLGDGLPTTRVVLPPNRTIQWDIVLSPEIVQALAMRPTEAARTLELTADADAWAVMALEIRNYHVRVDGLMVMLPTHADHYTPGTALLPVAIAVAVLGLLNALIDWKPKRRSLGLIGNALALTAVLVCLTCLILPRISPYTVLLSSAAFGLVAAGLFARILLYAFDSPRTLLASVRSRLLIVARTWNRHELTFERGAALLGLVAIAVAQPIFEVVANSPEFFPARSTPPLNVIGAVLALCLGVPLVLAGIERAVRAASPGTAATFHGVVVALLSAALMMPWLRRVPFLTLPWNAVAAALVGIATALAYRRMQAARQFLTALAPAALVVPALFLLDPGVRQHLLPSESAAAVETIERTPPIVLVVFDELPLNSLLTADGNIDAERYPNFGALAREAYWFRNASTVAYDTVDAVPAILSGRYATTAKAVPTLRYYPVNLFTALARHYDIFASMRFGQLCPPRACQQNSAIPADTLRSLVADLGLVWLHIVLPQELTDELPPVVGDWAEFVGTRETPMEGLTGRRGVFARFASAIDDRPARLYFIHLVLPHMQFEYVPSGRRYRGRDYQTTTHQGKGLFEGVSAAYADTLHQRHLAQVGFVDRLVGELAGRLREAGAYDKALVIITADHGASYREARSRRQPRPEQHNLSDILQVPLLMKLPGQRHGEIVDRMVETVDILPTILDVVGAGASPRLDGRSLIGRQAAERSPHTFFFRENPNMPPRAVGDLAAERIESLKRKEHRFGRGNLTALYAPPGARHLLGMRMSQSGLHVAPDVGVKIGNPGQFEAVRRDRDPLPLYVRGLLSTSRSDPLSVAVVVNGIVAAVAHSYRHSSGHVFGTLIPEAALRDGNNTVEAFVIDGL